MEFLKPEFKKIYENLKIDKVDKKFTYGKLGDYSNHHETK